MKKKIKKSKEQGKHFCKCSHPVWFSAWNRQTWIPANYGYSLCEKCGGVYPQKDNATIEDFELEIKIRTIVNEELSSRQIRLSIADY